MPMTVDWVRLVRNKYEVVIKWPHLVKLNIIIRVHVPSALIVL
jgi:hypothetical protein